MLNPAGNRHAAVALILRDTAAGPQLLFIERSRNPADPWSGQMAFPGGMVEAGDSDARGAAERETREEVAVDLTGAAYVGRLDDMQGSHRGHRGHRAGIVVSGFVFLEARRQRPSPNYEVAEIVWEPLASFMDEGRFSVVRHPLAPDERFPGVRIGAAEHQIVWGLTRRFMVSLFEIAGLPFLSTPSQHSLEESN